MINRFISDFDKYFDFALYSAKSELKAEVANSYLNWIWWVLEPVCFMWIYAFVFGYIFNSKEQYFPIFIFIGITCWDFFSRNLKNSVSMIKRNKSIVAKVYLPKWVFILSKIMVNGFKMLINWGIIIVMLIINRVSVDFRLVILVFPFLLLLFLLTFGCMCILIHFGVYVSDLNNIIDIVLRLLLYMTGIFYNLETKIGKNFPILSVILSKYNPMAYIITSIRKVTLYQSKPDMQYILFWLLVSLIIDVIGIRLIYKNENSYVKAI